MIHCIFTIDYEVYGNGEGSLAELVHEPARRLKALFEQAQARFVVFVEAAELERISAEGTDPAIGSVEEQVREFHRSGYEIALHLHPQWYNATFRGGKWELDYGEYNLCILPKPRITEIVRRATGYLRQVLGDADFTPLCFRAGNWLFQPTTTAAEVLAEQGIKLDSSVFKGGLQRARGLDYRLARKNGNYWRFQSDVNLADAQGALVEIPTYTRMVPFWQMFTAKRVGLQQKSNHSSGGRNGHAKASRLWDYLRFRYPLKFDFCRMTLPELKETVEAAIQDDSRQPENITPMVAIGHTKDLADFQTVEAFLQYLRQRRINVCTFRDLYPRLAAA